MRLVTLPIAHWLSIPSIQRLIHLAKYTGPDYVNEPLCIKSWAKSIKDAGIHHTKSTIIHKHTYTHVQREKKRAGAFRDGMKSLIWTSVNNPLIEKEAVIR